MEDAAHPPVANRVSVADVQVYVTASGVASAPVMAVQAVQLFALSHDPISQVAVHVVMTPVAPTVFFVVEDAAHPPVANRVSVADVQV